MFQETSSVGDFRISGILGVLLLNSRTFYELLKIFRNFCNFPGIQKFLGILEFLKISEKFPKFRF
jgi:hypothetical protein